MSPKAEPYYPLEEDTKNFQKKILRVRPKLVIGGLYRCRFEIILKLNPSLKYLKNYISVAENEFLLFAEHKYPTELYPLDYPKLSSAEYDLSVYGFFSLTKEIMGYEHGYHIDPNCFERVNTKDTSAI